MCCAFSVTKSPLEIKGTMEADHIPPMDSLKRAENEPNFNALQNSNKVLYDMVMSLKTDKDGSNLLVMEVSTPHHRVALSTGSSKESHAARGVVACSIARGEVTVMLKQAMIIAHPYCAQKIRENAGIATETTETQIDETKAFYRTVFLKMINYYCEKGLINEIEKSELEEYVNKDGYLEENSPEYQEILEAVRRSQR
ncbi:hypothetical protein N1851_030841 [Merluccius polli]|uniref:Uncharacterized protein n=1 Tax=Merluccius polli TaxID=89951 RepID=A0AA47NPP1_MERPO|nr:hypothetical protein N1851_030841 [Merluccius polli]